MKRWRALLGMGILSAMLNAGCRPDLPGWKQCDDAPNCDPTLPAQPAGEKLCPTETHTCMIYVGGGWDNVLQWKGERDKAPHSCPKAAARISFRGDVIEPNSITPEYAVGCGFAEAGTCEGVVPNGDDYLCAPQIPDWPACIVANSHRRCPPDYQAQTVVGSDEATDLEWTVCCVKDQGGPD
jgi:hypothetical protein